jgi:hypothetical protein
LRASGIHQKVRTMPASRSICWLTAIFTFARPRVRRCELLLNTHPQAASGTADAAGSRGLFDDRDLLCGIDCGVDDLDL